MVALSNILDSIKVAAQNPFGLDFEIHNSKIYIPVGSVLNCLGYNDYLERMIGIVRVSMGLIALACSKDQKERLIAAGHVIRGMFEMIGSYEKELLFLDALFTVYNVATRLWNMKTTDREIIKVG